MLYDSERKSLQTIFDRVRPDKITGLIDTLLESYKTNHTDDYSKGVVSILEIASESLHRLKNAPSQID